MRPSVQLIILESAGGAGGGGTGPVTNLVQHSNAFTTSPWGSSSTPWTGSAGISPDGTNDAWAGNSASGATNQTTQITGALFNGFAQTLSLYAKPNTAAGFEFGVLDQTTATFVALAAATWGGGGQPGFVTENGTPILGTQNVGNGWWRFWMTFIGTAGHSLRIFIYPQNAIAGNCNGEGNFFFGCQAVNGSSPGTYTPNP